ncbi:MAG: glycosyltransferase family 1 protein [Candidatus Cloacimonadota bacterium]|nr:MAG: glycosyltransferase family 1 protein [Candidatus Cloacimonadota bacterium]
MKKIRILHIQLLPLLSGVQNVMLDILDGLPKDKYEIWVMSRGNGPLIKVLKERKFHHIELKKIVRNISLSDISAFLEIYFHIRNYKFDIVHTHSSKPGFLGRIAAKATGTSLIVHTSHGAPYHEMQPFFINRFYKILEKIAGLFADKVVFVNNFIEEEAIDLKLIAPEKAVTIYNGIYLKKNIVKEIKNTEKIIVGTCSRFEKQKNIKVMTRAIIKACRKNKNLHFIMLGDGKDFDYCLNLVKSAGLEERIEMPGWQNPDERYPEFDYFLIYSGWEGLSISALDALSYGLPVVSSDIPAMQVLVKENYNGFLVDFHNPDKLTEVLANLKKDEKFLEMGKNSLKLADNFSVEKMKKEYLKLYEEGTVK